ncbi:MAG: hypothetical protein ACLFVT_00955 [Syntrophobacteria bacterium]
MKKDEKLLKAWDQLVKTVAQKEGLSSKQAVLHVKKHFPELYELYRQAKERQEMRVSR